MSARRRRGERGEARTAGAEGAAGEPGQVVAHHGVAVLVRFDSGDERQIWLATDQRAVVGDRVRVAADRLEVLPAHGVLRRRDPKGRDRTIAVNLDVLAIVIAPEPREPPGYIDRGFVIARAAGIEPRLVLNKIDLEAGPPLADRLQEIYGASALVHRVSAETGEGLDSIREALAGGRLGALVGPSGVGKSSLLNALVPDLELRVAELDRKTGRGRHTTTTATLHPSKRRSSAAVASATAFIAASPAVVCSSRSSRARSTSGAIAPIAICSTSSPPRIQLPDRDRVRPPPRGLAARGTRRDLRAPHPDRAWAQGSRPDARS
jgi:ribosome biogenesis GTPase